MAMGPGSNAMRAFPAGTRDPKGADMLRAAPSQFPHDPESAKGVKITKRMPPGELRERYGFWINDAVRRRVAMLYWEAPDASGKVKLRPVPSNRLRSFFDDVAFEWAAFADGATEAPPISEHDGMPLFDPRFARLAARQRTNGDAKAAAAIDAAAAAATASAAAAAAAAAAVLAAEEEEEAAKAKRSINDTLGTTHASPPTTVNKPPAPTPKARAKAAPKASAAAAAAAAAAAGAAAPPKKPLKRGEPPTIEAQLVHPDSVVALLASVQFARTAALYGLTLAPRTAGPGTADAAVAAAAAVETVSGRTPTGNLTLACMLDLPVGIADTKPVCRTWHEDFALADAAHDDTILTDA